MVTVPNYKLKVETDVRFRDTDAMGHVNNAVYLSYLELARLRYWWEILGVKSSSELGFILARAEVDFKSPIQLGEKVVVGIRCMEIRGASFDFDYTVWAKPWNDPTDKNLRIVAAAKTVIVCYDYEKAKPMRMPDSYRKKIEEFESRA